MAGKKSALIKTINDCIDRCSKHLEDLAPHLAPGKIPAIPMEGGQGYYERRMKYVDDNIMPLINSIEDDCEAMESAMNALATYVQKNSKRFWKKDAAKKAKTFLQSCQGTPAGVKAMLKTVIGIQAGALADDREALQTLKRLGVID